MNTLHLTDEQLVLVERALDFYSRIGIGQFERITDHPSFERRVYEHCTPQKEIEVGDRTPQGEVLEIRDGKALIKGSINKKTGHWQDKPEWKKLKDLKLSTDYSRYHQIMDSVKSAFVQPRNMLMCEPTLPEHASWGIYNQYVDDSCRVAFDIVQVIRHERWKRNPNRSTATVDSHIHFSNRKDESSNQIRCEMEAPEVEMKREISKEF
jgi:hypothetical protein